ncbi:methylmalonyl Co-A mutase-associated GTPase MeaB [Planococcus sp. 1R117A]|uniref:methylmalonyl Co-A mutase-associated GTPase MeaB n=1 Tax=Planococcus sp. 1R117A TaxID=3447020 RepID=UPI003EDC5CDD
MKSREVEKLEDLSRMFDEKSDVALGKFLKEVENQTSRRVEILKESATRVGKAHIIGITGPPGGGKSTLVSKICKELAKQDLQIAVVCVDPTSPFTQGALLGDRVRMLELAKFPNVFIKSLATRGNLGGLAASTSEIVQVFDAFDKDIILIETVGVGQIEFDVLEVADTVVLVNVPGLGDSMQTMKAGIMEVADVFVINQADRPGSDESVKDLRMMINESQKKDWKPPILKTIATLEEGITELISKVEEHKKYLQDSGKFKEIRETRNLKMFHEQLIHRIAEIVESYIHSEESIQMEIEEVKRGTRDPFTLAEKIGDKVTIK